MWITSTDEDTIWMSWKQSRIVTQTTTLEDVSKHHVRSFNWISLPLLFLQVSIHRCCMQEAKSVWLTAKHVLRYALIWNLSRMRMCTFLAFQLCQIIFYVLRWVLKQVLHSAGAGNNSEYAMLKASMLEAVISSLCRVSTLIIRCHICLYYWRCRSKSTLSSRVPPAHDEDEAGFDQASLAARCCFKAAISASTRDSGLCDDV